VSVDVPRIGVFGGLFNPPHLAHLMLSQEAQWQLGLSRVILVPAARPPHRPPPREAPEVRLRLAQAAARGNPLLTVSRVELDRPGPSYTSDTLRELAGRYPEATLVLLVGEDQLRALPRWHEAEEIPKLARIAVARRPDALIEGAERATVEWIDMPRFDVSSTQVRERVAAGRPIRYLVPEPVRELIAAEGLYR
jgi:nicotinate-nucleotide adenylyltransferase